MKCPILIIFVLAVFAPLVSAQPKELTKYEYVTQAYGAQAKTEREKRRVKTTHVYQDGPEVGDVVFETVEYEPQINDHSVTIRKTAKGTSREEFIRADGREFSKAGNGKWKERKQQSTISTTTGVGTMTGSGEVSTDEQRTEVYRRIGVEVIDGQETEVIASLKTFVENIGASKRISEFYQRVWIQKDGRIKKEESRSAENGKAWSHTVSVFEYDPNIRIEVPIRPASRRK